ncbi:MAG: sulfite exporter TauE/SafE family protein [Bellilinea sp.]
MTTLSLWLIAGLAVLSLLSGMLGLGVAFAALPFFSFFMTDIVHQVQPLTLLLNGVTALFSAFGFARSGLIDWKKAILLGIVTTVSAPLGSWLAQLIPQIVILVIYFASVIFLAFNLFRPIQKREEGQENFKLALILAIPISVLAGFLGVGPGFLLLPTLILVGFEPKRAAGINAFAVTPPSFSALIPHLKTAVWDPTLTLILLVVGAGLSFLGARITSSFVPNQRLKQMFGSVIVVMTAYKLFSLIFIR